MISLIWRHIRIMIEKINRLMLVIGGSGSGKSEFAEHMALKLHDCNRGHLYYVATMVSHDKESDERIYRHVRRRDNTAFETIERPTGIDSIAVQDKDVILLECMSNLLANEMFKGDIIDNECVTRILDDVYKLHNQCDMVIVSNEVSLDGCEYDDITKQYIADISYINRKIADVADTVVEVVAGIPVYIKGSGEN